MADNVLADAAPLCEVLWRLCSQRGELSRIDHPVLDSHAKTEERFNAIRFKSLHERICEDKSVVLWIALVGVEVGEEVGDVNEYTVAEPSANVMETRIRNASFLEIVQHRPVLERADHRRLPDSVNRLYYSDCDIRLNGDMVGRVVLLVRRLVRRSLGVGGNCGERRPRHQAHNTVF